MPLTPDDIEHATFPRERRGYAAEEVDVFLDRVHARVMELLRERDELRSRLRDAERRASEGAEEEALLTRTLVVAQRAADDTIEEARRSAAQAVEDARREAAALREEAEAESAQLLAQAREQAAQELEAARMAARRTERAIADLRRFSEEHRASVRETLTQQLAALDRVGAIPELADEVEEFARRAAQETVAAPSQTPVARAV